MAKRRLRAPPIGGGEEKASPAPAALSRLNQAGVDYRLVESNPKYLVAGSWEFYPHNGYWRDAAGTRGGYGVDKLIAAIKRGEAATSAGLEGVAAAMAEPQPEPAT